MAVLSLSEREQQILSRIAEELARTAPALMSLLTGFNRIALGEDMPVRRPLRRLRRLRRRLSTRTLTWGFVSVWGVITASMISTALILSSVSHA